MAAYWIFAAQLVLFLLFNLLLGIASYGIAHRLGENKLTRPELLVSALVVFFSQVVGYQLALGILGRLTYVYVLMLGAVSTTSLLVWLRRKGTFALPAFTPKQWLLSWYTKAGLFPLVLLALIILALGVELFAGLVRAPVNGDDLGYHLPFAVTWLQTGQLFNRSAPFWFYPGTSELFTLWLLAPFRNDFLISLQNWPPLLLTMVSIYALTRRAGLSIAWSICAAAFPLGIRALHYQINTQNNDLALTAFFLAAVVMFFASHRTHATGNLVVAGLAMGLITGLKYNGAFYAALLLAAYVSLEIRHQRLSRTFRHLLLMVLIAVLMGGYWYARNWAITGNPLTPLQIRLGNQVLFPGQELFMGNHIQDTMLIGRLRDAEALRLFVDALGTNGLLTLFALPILALSCVIWILEFLSRKSSRSPQALGLQLSLCLGTLALLSVTPLLVENVPQTLNQLRDAYSPIRYGFTTWALAGILLAWLLSHIEAEPISLSMKTLIALAVLIPFSKALILVANLSPLGVWVTALPTQKLLWLSLLAGVGVFVEMYWRHRRAGPHKASRNFAESPEFHRLSPEFTGVRSRISQQVAWCVTALLFVGIIIGISTYCYQARLASRNSIYVGFLGPDYPVAIQRVTDGASRRLAVIGWQVPYFWYGADFRNQVILCPWATPELLTNCMTQHQVDTLVIVHNPYDSGMVIVDNPSFASMLLQMSPVYEDANIKIYEIAGPA